MKQKEFVEKLAERSETPAKVVEAFMEHYNGLMKEVLKSHGEVTINEMGKFVLQNKPARTAKNPMTGETVQVPAKTVAKWKPNKKFKDAMFA